nr:BspA family leucine-rich repeat surface protein [uncultured Prevotella sp.]
MNDDQEPEWITEHKADIVRVVFDVSFASARPKSCNSWFMECEKLEAIDGIENLNTSMVTDMWHMFDNCKSLTYLDLKTFDTHNVLSMSYMFFGCNNLTYLNVSSFDTSKVGNMMWMFAGCWKLTTNFDMHSVRTMLGMFSSCKGLTHIDVSHFNTENVENMQAVFQRCEKLTSLDLSGFNTSKVEDIACMFLSCMSLTSLDLSNFDTQLVTQSTSLFYECQKLEAIYLGDKFSLEGLSKLYASNNMFGNCSATLYCSPAAYWASKNCSRVKEAGQAVKPYVSINKTPEYGTLCVPVGSSLVAGSFTGFDKLYQVTNADKNKGTITLTEAKSIEPGVPYVYHRYLEGVDFDGKNNMSVITFDVDGDASAAVTAPKNEGSLLKGTFESMVAKGGSYILQTDGNFHPVAADNTTLKVGAYRAYLDLSSTEIGGGDEGFGEAKAYSMVFEDGEATGIDRINGDGSNKGIYDQADLQPKVYFDLMGRKVAAPQKGEIYIVNGKKVVYNK